MATALWSHWVCSGLFCWTSFSCSHTALAQDADVTGADGSSVQDLPRAQAVCQAPIWPLDKVALSPLRETCDVPFGVLTSGQREGHRADFLSHLNLIAYCFLKNI